MDHVTTSPIESKTRERYPFVDLLKAVAIVLVLVDHNCGFEGKLDDSSLGEWTYPNLVKTLSKVAVPLFFMCTGFTLIKPIESLPSFYQSRLRRIAVPFLFWCVVYLQVRVHLEANQISFLSGIRSIWIGEVYYHLWFMYALIGMYITIPFLASFRNGERGTKANQLIVGFTVIWFFYHFMIPSASSVLESTLKFNFKPNFHLGFFGGHIGYATLGYMLGHLVPSRRSIRLSVVLFLLSWIFITAVNFLSERHPTQPHLATAFLSPAGIVMAGSAFFIIRWASPIHLPKWITRISALTFPIYLSHPLLMIALLRFPITSALFHSDHVVARVAVLLPVSYLFSLAISKIPYVRKIAA